MCVFGNRRLEKSEKKKAKIFIKSDSWSLLDFFNFICREERDIYTRTDIYIHSLEGKESTMVTTRGRKRKIGRRDSLWWDLIVNNDDICFKHILPR